MTALYIARARIIDTQRYTDYAARAPQSIADHGGRFLVRGGRHQVMEGPTELNRVVVIEFPTFEQGVGWFTSPEYQVIAGLRRDGGGEVQSIMVEAYDTPAEGGR